MIKGLKLQFQSESLKRHCELRAAHHVRRAEEKELRLVELKQQAELLKGDKPQSLTNIISSNYRSDFQSDFQSMIASLEKDIADHRAKEKWFLFVGGQLFPNEEYELSTHEIVELEFVKRV